MIIIGHRGARGLAPQNTRQAFRAGIRAGADWIEFDVRRTLDGRVVVAHDPHLFTASLRPVIIGRTTYSNLKKLPTRNGQPILALSEACNAIEGQAAMNIEIKTAGCAQDVVRNVRRLVKNGAHYDDFLVSSFYPQRLREVAALDERIPLGLLHALQPKSFLQLHDLPSLKAVGFHHRFLPTADGILQAKQRGLMVYAYTVNTTKRARQLLARGVQGIVTDRPDKLRSLKKN